MKLKIAYLLIFITIVSPNFSCKKYLEKVPDKSLSLPKTLEDYQQLLDRNESVDNSTPGIGDLSSDDYYLGFTNYQSLGVIQRNAYIWTNDTWQGLNSLDWSSPYSIIYYSNVVINALKDYQSTNAVDQEKRNNVYGHALFLRAYEHFSLQETFGQPYIPNTAASDLGIPIKLNTNLEEFSSRATVKQTFDQIISDLELSSQLLPATTSVKLHPSKMAAYSVLARVYLTMQNYDKAAEYSNKALQITNVLFDYNNLSNPAATNPFPAPPNDFIEVIYPSYQVGYGVIRLTTTSIDTTLYASYDNNDLRKSVFFGKNNSTNTYYFKGNYSGSSLRQLSGPAIDEVYLIRAESNVRRGLKDSALADLNKLLKTRWKKTAIYNNLTANTNEEALRIILNERRKELIFRGLRWSDLRRLNQDTRFALSIKRLLNNQTYSLPPNDLRYTFLIPTNEIQVSGIQQNRR